MARGALFPFPKLIICATFFDLCRSEKSFMLHYLDFFNKPGANFVINEKKGDNKEYFIRNFWDLKRKIKGFPK